ncbi:MAG: hypothetical protein OEL77_02970 [Nitrosopumilus sp.]|nr:hypothetical protein [Nitrosopumilus sp.]MDH3384957.1 hypothetical protein [Nitrosopumilus sp.]
MNEKCICGHEINDHVRGPIEEIQATSKYTMEPVENRLNCKNCDCHKYQTKLSWAGRFWNGSE